MDKKQQPTFSILAKRKSSTDPLHYLCKSLVSK